MSTDLDRVIREAAVKNGVGLRKDDPVMTLVTIMNTIIDDQKVGLSEQQKVLLVHFAEKVEESLSRINVDMKENAERSVNAAATYAKDMLPKVMTAGASEAVKAAKGELASMLHDFHCTVASFKQWTLTGMIVVSASAVVAVVVGMVQIIVALKA